MQSQILKANPEHEYYFDEGCFILELSNSLADPTVSIARATVKPGVTTKLHCLIGVIERYVVLSGCGLVEVAGLPKQELVPGDVVLIPPECSQRISNQSDSDLVFLAICTPRFTPECYRSLE